MPTIRKCTESDKNDWDEYVRSHPEGSVFHLTAWKEVIEQTFGHKSIYLLATEKELKGQSSKLKGIDTVQLSPEPCALRPSSNRDSKVEKLGSDEAERQGSKKKLNAEGQTRIQRTTDNRQRTQRSYQHRCHQKPVWHY